MTLNNNYKLIDFKLTIINLFSFFQSNIWLKSSEDRHKVLFTTKYLYTEHFSKLHLAVPACCAGLYTESFSKGHRALHACYVPQRHLLTSHKKYKLIDFKMTILNLFSLFRSDKGFKGSKDWHKVFFATKYLYMYVKSIFQNYT